MNIYYNEALRLKDSLIFDRRNFHRNPEILSELPKTKTYVMKRLIEMGYDPQEICEGGIVAYAGNLNGKTILLRADMDALPMCEESNISFKSLNGYAHTCGHDMHTSMLLGAAQILKDHENQLKGCIKFMFQPDEECITGAKAMIDAGVLENVDTAMALHVVPGPISPGTIFSKSEAVNASQDKFIIRIEGKGGHGAMPHETIDPISISAHIIIALQEIISRELDSTKPVTLTIGKICSGESANIIPQRAEMEGTIRSYSQKARNFTKKRLVEVSEMIAKTFRGRCIVEFVNEIPCNFNDQILTDELHEYIKQMNVKILPYPKNMASEDFALISEQIPSSYFFLAAGGDDSKYAYPIHSPKVQFNENALPYGAAIFAQCAVNWLKNH